MDMDHIWTTFVKLNSPQSVHSDHAYAVYSPTTLRTIKAGSKKRGDLRLHRPGSAVRKVASNGVIEVADR